MPGLSALHSMLPSGRTAGDITPQKRMLLHLVWFEKFDQICHQTLSFKGIIAIKIANVYIQGGSAFFWPGVQAQVRLSQQHGGRDTTRTVPGGGKGVKQLCHRL